MRPRLLRIVALVAITLLNSTRSIKFDSSYEDVTVGAQRNKLNSGHTAKEWIKAPNGFFYQFHVGYQSWLAAREFCLSQNSDLVTLKSEEQVNWLLNHYVPTYPQFAERFIQIGLLFPEEPNRDWINVDGSMYNQSLVPWISGEPFDHSVTGKERCALLRVRSRLLDDVDCEYAPSSHVRFICERQSEIHMQQQRSGNYLWRKVEELMNYFRIWTGSDVKKESTNNTSTQENDYEVTSTEKELYVNIANETSEEEEVVVTSLLENIGKPEKTVMDHQRLAHGEGLKESETSQYDELKPTSVPANEEIKKTSASGESTVLSSETAVHSSKELTTETIESHSAIKSNTEKIYPAVDNAVVVNTTIATEAEKTGEQRSVETVKDNDVLARAAPLLEIGSDEGSGVEVERNVLEDSVRSYHEIEPEKLEQVIRTMEKMIEKLENISDVEKEFGEKAVVVLLEESTTDAAKRSKVEDKLKHEQRKKVESSDSLVGISEKQKTEIDTLNEMEKDFDEDLNKELPATDIKPKNDDDCDEEASGSNSKNERAILGDGIDSEEFHDLSQKPKIPVERDEHVQDFLQTLRTFLNRAEHNDLRKLLDENPGKTLLEKMKLAIALANEREFNRLKELELMKQNGIDISTIPDPVRMPDTIREELFRKIRGVVISEVEKLEVEKATEPPARTTTEEKQRTASILKNKEQTRVVERLSSKEHTLQEKIPEKKAIRKQDIKKAEIVGSKGHAREQDEQLQQVKAKVIETTEKQEEAKKEAMEIKKEELEKEKISEKVKGKQLKSNELEVTPNSTEPLARTIHLKEFDDKNEIMSRESENLRYQESDDTKESLQKIDKQQKEDESIDLPLNSTKSGEKENAEIQNVFEEIENNATERQSLSSKQNEKPRAGDGDGFITASLKGEDNHSEEEVGTKRTTVDIVGEEEINGSNQSEIEVGTEKIIADNEDEKKRQHSEKENTDESLGTKAEKEDNKLDTSNPLGLPTLPPPPTLPPLPSIKELFENLAKEWRKLFKPPKLLPKL